MLLKKIRTKGFLGHLANENNDFVELDFADKNLWLIQGANGAGKSSLFDAITMAFFKQHRGGASNFTNLIHDKAQDDEAKIFVEFSLCGKDYQIAVNIPKSSSTISRKLQFWNGAEWETKNVAVKDWVAENLKISYETFISSVLLRQGEADKFILAQPKDRKKVFLELMQLEFYTQLAKCAKDKQTEANRDLVKEKQSLENLENPSATDIKTQERLVKQFGKELENLEKEKSAKQKELEDSKQAQKLQNDIKNIEAQQKLDEPLFENAAQVEEKYKYFGELKENLMRIENVWREKKEIARIGVDFQANERSLIELSEKLKIVIGNLNKSLSTQTLAETDLTKLQDKLTSLKNECDGLKQKIDEIGRVETLENQIERANEGFQTVQKNVAEAVEKIAKLEKQIEAKTSEKDEFDIRLQECKTNLEVWSDRLENRRKVVDADECPTCGNELKREEIREKLIADFEEAEQKVAELKQNTVDLNENIAETKEQFVVINTEFKTETAKYQTILQAENSLKTKIETLNSQITVSYTLDQRKEIRNNFAEAERQVADFASNFNTLQDGFKKYQQTTVDLENSKIRLESNLSNVQQNQENLQQQKQNAENNLKEAQNQIVSTWQNHAALQNESELEILRREKNDLQNIETEYRNLSDAITRKGNLEGQKELATKQFQEIPESHRRDVLQVGIEFDEITAKIGIVKMKSGEADNILRKMQEDNERYEEKSGELKLLETDLRIWKTLAKALGKDGLETKVVREAQQKIEDNANKTLQALSDGRFKIEIPTDSKEMKIFVRDFSTGEQRQIEYFSGGEKFLTAVSLAVAIGQSASGQNIANTLIIDEGFGSLDDKNRSLMVGELTRLSEILQNGRVIIVSHQDDVQENFANRFRLNKTGEGFINVQVNL